MSSANGPQAKPASQRTATSLRATPSEPVESQRTRRTKGIIERRQLWGALLVLGGVYTFFALVLQREAATGATTLQFAGAALAVLVTVSGLALMFLGLWRASGSLVVSALPRGGADLEYAVSELSRNYEILRRQTSQGFLLSGVFMALGFLVVLSGSAGSMLGMTTEAADLTSVAGIVLEFISGTSLLIYRLNFHRLNQTSDQLNRTWSILAAYRLTRDLPPDKKAEVTMNLIAALVRP